MTQKSGYTFFFIIGFIIILATLGYALHIQRFDTLMVMVFTAIGGYLMLINLWAYSAAIDVETPMPSMGAGVHAVVFGFLLILVSVTLRLMKLPLDEALIVALPILGLLLVVAGFAVAISRLHGAEWGTRALDGEAMGRGKAALARSYGMKPSSGHALVTVIGFVLILVGITLVLHLEQYDKMLLGTLIGMGAFIMLLSRTLFKKTGVVRIYRPYRFLGFTTLMVIVGFLGILILITLHLMKWPLEQWQLTPDLISLAGAVCLALILFGLVLTYSGKRTLRLRPD